MVEQKSTGIEVIETLKAQPIVYRDQRCVTLSLVDQMHERRPDTAGNAFRRRKERFKEGCHYFSVPYVEAQQLFNGSTLNVEPKRGGHKGGTILITEKGYCLLAKVFDDDRAWAVQEELVEGYFRAVKPSAGPIPEDVLDHLGEQISQRAIAHIESRLSQLAPRIPEPHYTIRDRLETLGWSSAGASRRDKIRNLALALLHQAGYPRPVRESNSPAAELLFPASQVPVLDEAILRIWDEARRQESRCAQQHIPFEEN